MSDPRKAVSRIRGKRKLVIVKDPVDIRIEEAMAQVAADDLYQTQVSTIRDRSLEKAKKVRLMIAEQKQREYDRSREIEKKRLKNLTKARRALRKKRSNEQEKPE